MSTHDDALINSLRDKTIAKLRTIVPAVWGIVAGLIVTWAVTKGWVGKDVAYQYQGVVITATGSAISGIFVAIVYSLAQWVEERRGPFARFVAKALLVVLAPPRYSAPSPVVTRPDPTPELEVGVGVVAPDPPEKT